MLVSSEKSGTMSASRESSWKRTLRIQSFDSKLQPGGREVSRWSLVRLLASSLKSSFECPGAKKAFQADLLKTAARCNAVHPSLVKARDWHRIKEKRNRFPEAPATAQCSAVKPYKSDVEVSRSKPTASSPSALVLSPLNKATASWSSKETGCSESRLLPNFERVSQNRAAT